MAERTQRREVLKHLNSYRSEGCRSSFGQCRNNGVEKEGKMTKRNEENLIQKHVREKQNNLHGEQN